MSTESGVCLTEKKKTTKLWTQQYLQQNPDTNNRKGLEESASHCHKMAETTVPSTGDHPSILQMECPRTVVS